MSYNDLYTKDVKTDRSFFPNKRFYVVPYPNGYFFKHNKRNKSIPMN